MTRTRNLPGFVAVGAFALCAPAAAAQTYNVDIGRDLDPISLDYCPRECDATASTCSFATCATHGNVYDEGVDDGSCCTGQPTAGYSGPDAMNDGFSVKHPGLVMNLDWFFDTVVNREAPFAGTQCFDEITRHGSAFVIRDNPAGDAAHFGFFFDATTDDGKKVTYHLVMLGDIDDPNNWPPAPGTTVTVSLDWWTMAVDTGSRKNGCEGEGPLDCIDAATGNVVPCVPGNPDHAPVIRAYVTARCGDGICDTDEECTCELDCTPPLNETSCSDGLDNDCDGAPDCNDPDCDVDAVCACTPTGDSCSRNSDCCSGSCKGKPGEKTCK